MSLHMTNLRATHSTVVDATQFSLRSD